MRLWMAGMAAVFVAGCSTTTKPHAAPHDPTVLRVGIAPNTPPYAFKKDGQLQGMEVIFARELGKALNRSVRFVEMKFENLIPALEENRIDIIMSGMTETDGRSIRVAFCKPYMKMGQMILMRATDVGRYKYPQVVLLSEARIGTQEGSTGDLLVLNATKDAKRVPFSTAAQAAEAMVKKKVDAVIHDGPVILTLSGQYERDNFVVMRDSITEEYLAWAVRKDDENLRNAVIDVQDKWDKDGTTDALMRRGMPFTGM